MRKLLLFALVLGVSSLGYAQNVNSFVKVGELKSSKEVIDNGAVNQMAPVNMSKTTQKGSITSVPISSSANVYSYLVETQTVVTANQDINLINVTHRANPSVLGSNSGDIVSSFSKDGGTNWDHIITFEAGAGPYHRYPGGVIHNPTGNTNPDNAYLVTVGPSTDGSNWVSMYTSSNKFDSTGFDTQLFPSYGSLPRVGFQSTTDGKFHVITSNYNDVTGNLDTIRLYEGTWNTTNNAVDWVCHKLDANFVLDNAGDEFVIAWNFNTAWSTDGVTGYYWTLGRDSSNDTRSYQPIVWKTTNSGGTWAKMPVYDFSTLTAITDELRPMLGTTSKRPQFSTSMDGVVDANGNLHLISQIGSCYSNNDDSLGYSFVQTFEGLPGHNTIFDVYTTSSGWDAVRLGYIYTVDVSVDDTPYGTQGWDLRLQAGKSIDETKIFATWTDTDTSFAMQASNGFPMNSFPDIYAVGLDITNGYRTVPTNFTEGTSVAGDAFFHYMSDLILSSGGDYTLPMTELDLGTLDSDPVYLNYLKGISFSNTDFVPNPGFATRENSIISVSQNRPNPFNGITNIEVNLTESSDLSVEVINVAGQLVFNQQYGKATAGSHNLSIDGSNLASGIYFYTVRAGNSTITNKMIVR